MSPLSQGALGTVGVDDVTQRGQSEQRGGSRTQPRGWGEKKPIRGSRKNPARNREKNQPESQGKQVFVGRDADQGKMLKEQEK